MKAVNNTRSQSYPAPPPFRHQRKSSYICDRFSAAIELQSVGAVFVVVVVGKRMFIFVRDEWIWSREMKRERVLRELRNSIAVLSLGFSSMCRICICHSPRRMNEMTWRQLYQRKRTNIVSPRYKRNSKSNVIAYHGRPIYYYYIIRMLIVFDRCTFI